MKVAEINADISRKHGFDERKCFTAGLLHDISTVIKPDDMLAYAKSESLSLCTGEKRFPSLLHQRLSTIAANEY